MITGPRGQDGTLLARHLGDLGYRVIGVVRPGFLQSSSSRTSAIELVEADICDEATWLRLLSSYAPSEIYHLAACHHSTEGPTTMIDHRLKRAMLETNFISTKALSFALLEAGGDCRVVYAGSSQMYSAERSTHEIDENAHRKPRSFYGHTKAWSTELLGRLRRDCGLRASTAILFNHESPLRGPRFVSRKISQAAAAARRGDPVRLELLNIGSRADWSNASDVVRALQLIGSADTTADFVVASGELHSVRSILDIAFGHVQIDWTSIVTTRTDVKEPTLVGCSALIEGTLGWRRNSTFEETITQMVDADLGVVPARDR